MKELHLNIEELTGLQVQEIADWRWRKAKNSRMTREILRPLKNSNG